MAISELEMLRHLHVTEAISDEDFREAFYEWGERVEGAAPDIGHVGVGACYPEQIDDLPYPEEDEAS